MQIKQDKRNYRKHSDKNKRIIKKSLTELGAGRSILIDANNEIIAGNGVYEQWGNRPIKVIETDGKELVVVKRTDLQTDDKKRQTLALIDNHASDTSDFDNELINSDFESDELNEWEFESEIDNKIEAEDDNFTEPENVKTDIINGDLFEIECEGLKHRLLCGDSTKSEDIKRLMNGEYADCIFTDPPYELETSDLYLLFNEISKNTNILIFASDKQIPFIFDAKIGVFKRLYTLDTGIASPTNNDVYVNHIALLRFKIGNATKFQNIFNGGRSIIKMDYRKNLKDDNTGHKHQKSLETLSLFLRYWSIEYQLVVDLFGGSGSTLIASHQLKRNCYLNEFDPKNCQIIIDRFKKSYPNASIKKISN